MLHRVCWTGTKGRCGSAKLLFRLDGRPRWWCCASCTSCRTAGVDSSGFQFATESRNLVVIALLDLGVDAFEFKEVATDLRKLVDLRVD